MGCLEMPTNADLRSLYDEWHGKGPTAWFSDGKNEREAILKMGEPWDKVIRTREPMWVLEIGCGEGDLANQIFSRGVGRIYGIDYSEAAIWKAKNKSPGLRGVHGGFIHGDYRTYEFWRHTELGKAHRIVLQGVLEHFDDPWAELGWIIDNLLADGGDVITSSPCFLNPRGIVWMTLATLFDAPMSLTDLHFLHPWEFAKFAKDRNMDFSVSYTDESWGNDAEMIVDLAQRLPKVFPDMESERIKKLLDWLAIVGCFFSTMKGATAVYKLRKN